jgi:hypothetical protein
MNMKERIRAIGEMTVKILNIVIVMSFFPTVLLVLQPHSASSVPYLFRQKKKEDKMNLNRYVGCCGAYCKTCKPFQEDVCKGCKIGFDTGDRDINKAKCKIKLCCFRDKGKDTCADCSELASCNIINEWYSKNGYKYKKYKETIYYIKENGYEQFFEIADNWKNAYGKCQ